MLVPICRLKAHKIGVNRYRGAKERFLVVCSYSECVSSIVSSIIECFERSTHKSHCVIAGKRTPPTHQRASHFLVSTIHRAPRGRRRAPKRHIILALHSLLSCEPFSCRCCLTITYKRNHVPIFRTILFSRGHQLSSLSPPASLIQIKYTRAIY